MKFAAPYDRWVYKGSKTATTRRNSTMSIGSMFLLADPDGKGKEKVYRVTVARDGVEL